MPEKDAASPHPTRPALEGAVAAGTACRALPAVLEAVDAGTPRLARSASGAALTPRSPLAAMGKVAARVLLHPTGKRSENGERGRNVRRRRDG
jgi:hypothetical protein